MVSHSLEVTRCKIRNIHPIATVPAPVMTQALHYLSPSPSPDTPHPLPTSAAAAASEAAAASPAVGAVVRGRSGGERPHLAGPLRGADLVQAAPEDLDVPGGRQSGYKRRLGSGEGGGEGVER